MGTEFGLDGMEGLGIVPDSESTFPRVRDVRADTILFANVNLA
jgi:hypothetical protein